MGKDGMRDDNVGPTPRTKVQGMPAKICGYFSDGLLQYHVLPRPWPLSNRPLIFWHKTIFGGAASPKDEAGSGELWPALIPWRSRSSVFGVPLSEGGGAIYFQGGYSISRTALNVEVAGGGDRPHKHQAARAQSVPGGERAGKVREGPSRK